MIEIYVEDLPRLDAFSANFHVFDLFLLCYVSIFNMVSINRSRGLSFTLTMDY